MAIRDKMTKQFTCYPGVTPVRQVVREIESGKTGFYIALQDPTGFTVTTLPAVKQALATLADGFGPASLDLTLSDVGALWHPQTALDPSDDEDTALSNLRPGAAVPVVERGSVVGILARTTRAIGSSSLGSMYGPRFALFGDQAPAKGTPAAPARTCPHCGKTIDFFKPKRVNGVIERHCPNCDWVFPE